ncbi:LysM peptidoglycan-binding domain-containing protein [Bailinhaonella thermotolerans]|uniref:LysM peptidoglycan-binding domain-containing protein n=1 Tax=Bailinhaonella thermotolerans TaxID=1070861 RepID=A0A3A4AZ92_9ACTN|nr:LysM peptidoglycan-binding domain-containing protein [Bailinhaonella thermotolerans]RJL34443.1 LysM peptidoglycan-binding domain-containing protein [Bailinhaonella thermotolerans]
MHATLPPRPRPALSAPARPRARRPSPAARGPRRPAPGPRPGRDPLRPLPPLRLTRRGRAVLVAAALPVLLAAVWLGTRAPARSAPAVPPSHQGLPWVTVQSGDTLWEIAHQVAPAEDPARTVHAIMRLNALDTSVIQPGARLYIPAPSTP